MILSGKFLNMSNTPLNVLKLPWLSLLLRLVPFGLGLELVLVEFLFLEEEVVVVFLLGLLRLLLLLLLLLFFDFFDFLTVFDVLLLFLEGLEFGLVVLGEEEEVAAAAVLFSKLTSFVT